MRRATWLVLLFAFSAHGAAPAGDLLVAEGMRRAQDSDLHWQVRDGTHPTMGPIKVAISLEAHTSFIGTSKVVSTVYLSCVNKTGKIALELTNARSIEPTLGLKLKEAPILTCLGIAKPGAAPPRSPIAATWEANELGDMLTRGLSPSALRACAAIDVQEKILLPPALGREIEEVTFEIPTYATGPDEVFTACGEATAYPAEEKVAPVQKPAVIAQAPRVVPAPPAPAPAPKVAPAEKLPSPSPVVAPVPVPVPAPAPAPVANAPWKRAHTVSNGRSNVRKAPDLSSPVVAQLPPGVRVLVEPASGDWWHVKSPSGATFDGYIRGDRFTFD